MLSKYFKRDRDELFSIAIYIICYTVIFSIFTVSKHNVFHSHSFDLGIFDQVFWSIVHHGTELNTLETLPLSATPVNHLGVHFSLIFYFLAPIYAVFQSPKTLLILQSFALGLGALPLYLIAKKYANSTLFSQVLCISYLLYNALHNINTFEFHEVAFAPVLLLSTLYFLESKNFKWFWIFFALSLFVKEDVALSGIFIGLYVFWGKKEKKLGALIAIISLVYFLLTLKVFMPLIGQPYNYVDRYSALKSLHYSGYEGILYTIIAHPFYTLQYVFFDPRKILYLVILFYPVLFLPFFSKKSFVLILPSLFTNLLSSYPDQYSIHTQYSAIIIPFLFFTSVMGYANLPKKLEKYKKVICYIIIVLTIVSVSSATFKSINRNTFFIYPDVPENASLRMLLKEIPPDAPVAAIPVIVPHLSQRNNIWLLPNINNAEYILFDIKCPIPFEPLSYDQTLSLLKQLLQQKRFGVFDQKDNYVILKKDFSAARNGEILAKTIEQCGATILKQQSSE
jgi:uncharacterized membrane protein